MPKKVKAVGERATPELPERFNEMLRSVVKGRTPAELARLTQPPKGRESHETQG